ncbi:MAG: hypothetical protein BAJATHORv1_40111 [Candidatus Thorarchaeota archaeon]|nr:MAG: hypothetical protein BAJATHORv1_40111 [Candidatus Thorarchaeota archaeon]
MSNKVELQKEEREEIIHWKKGVRVLGISESFTKEEKKSTVVGVVMRGDLRVDGFGICQPTIGGMDVTSLLLDMYFRLERDDIRSWLLGGTAISWFNIIDIVELYEKSGIPVVAVSYNPSDGINKYIQEYFPEDWKTRLEAFHNGPEREPINLLNGYRVFVRSLGFSKKSAVNLLNSFTIDGRIPEPIRMARLIASAIQRDLL